MTVRSLLVLVLLGLFVPTSALADSFHSLNTRTVFQSRNNFYRLRATTKPWQLAEAVGSITQTAFFDETLFAVLDDHLYESSDGLAYNPVTTLPVLSETTLVQATSQLFVAGRTAEGVEVWQHTSRLWQKTTGLALNAPTDLRNLTHVNGDLVALVTTASLVETFRLVEANWLPGPTLSCPARTVITLPMPVVICVDGTSFRLSDQLEWKELFALLSEGEASSDQVVAALAHTDHHQLFLATDSTTLAIQLEGSEAPIALFVAGDRVLLKFPTLGLYEILWRNSNPELIFISPMFTAVVPISNDPTAAFVSAGLLAYFSPAAGQWQSISSNGDFNHGYKTSAGWFVWQTNEAKSSGGLAQVLSQGAGTLTKVNSWSSTTSPIQAVSLDQFPAYVSVITNSGTGNTNLYKSNDLSTWSRITLPTKPTLIRGISQARLLPADTLVELAGSVSVPSGIVGSEIEYLHDETGGIQIFLSKSKGTLDFPKGRRLVATGEISSSSTRRVLLDAVDDVSSLGDGQLFTRAIAVGEAADFQGWVVTLNDRISALETDELKFAEALTVNVEALGQSAKELFHLQDQVELSAVVDWNSSSANTEAWYLGDGYRIVAQAPPVEPKPQSPPKTAKTTVASTPKKTTTKVPITVKTSSVQPSVKAVRSSTKPVLVDATQSLGPVPPVNSGTSSSDTWAIGLLGIAAGMLAIQGRRLQKFRSP